ncbi:glycosyltransferase [Eilatimonas milleporae]|uniref:Glycosyl transferase family 28 n=1 Tax=Eilatimonas milleporae TaxID=911205 RepID=A0A3M0CUS7_9PROT|nr:glycosyltransferase [Eilatimonas milleporae]RMB12280.1 glycosyl transferase family 28 [Eilatimonas milleporae]
MIFATVGTQLPFDRLIQALDKWSLNQGVKGNFCQIGPAGTAPLHMAHTPTLTPVQFAKRIAECKAIVSHAGMGTILTALQAGKPIIILPRLARYGEHRNDHQLATAANLQGRAGIHVAGDEDTLAAMLDDIGALTAGGSLSDAAEPRLIDAIRDFIAQPAIAQPSIVQPTIAQPGPTQNRITKRETPNV